jgi:hypothetical protein
LQLWWRGDPLLWTHTAASNARMVVLSSVQQAEVNSKGCCDFLQHSDFDVLQTLLSLHPPWMRDNPNYDERVEHCRSLGQRVQRHQHQHWGDIMALLPSFTD